MARIRTIKPEFFTHVGLYDLEIETGLPIRISFAGLWTLCDREGRFKWVPKQLKLGCIPYDNVDFSRVLDALNSRGFVERYTSDNNEYGFIPSWSIHQVINNRETKSVLPEPNENNILTRERRVNDEITTPLCNAQVERKGKEGKGREGDICQAENLPDVSVKCDDVFDYWKMVMHSQKSKLDTKRKKLINDRLKTYSVDDLKTAIHGCSVSPFHMGTNDRGAKYNSIELILRDSGKIDQFIGYSQSPPKAGGSVPNFDFDDVSWVHDYGDAL